MFIFFIIIGFIEGSIGDYETLGIPVGSDMDTVKAAYRREALRWHPDRNPDPNANDVFI